MKIEIDSFISLFKANMEAEIKTWSIPEHEHEWIETAARHALHKTLSQTLDTDLMCKELEIEANKPF